MKPVTEDICPLCGGSKAAGAVTFSADLGETLVVVRNVPATVCGTCGNEWLEDKTAAILERVVETARREKHSVEITEFRRVA